MLPVFSYRRLNPGAGGDAWRVYINDDAVQQRMAKLWADGSRSVCPFVHSGCQLWRSIHVEL
jgi:hypothetical protein